MPIKLDEIELRKRRTSIDRVDLVRDLTRARGINHLEEEVNLVENDHAEERFDFDCYYLGCNEQSSWH